MLKNSISHIVMTFLQEIGGDKGDKSMIEKGKF
jgi:hypothetical protein